MKVNTPAPPMSKPSTSGGPGKYDGDNPGILGKYKRSKGSGPAEKIYDTTGPFGKVG